MAVLSYSRYEFTTPHEDDEGRMFLAVPDPISKEPNDDENQVIVGEGDDLFTIAWRAYMEMLNTEIDLRPTGFFWVIAQMNDIVDAAAPLEVGSTLRVPGIETLQGEILDAPVGFTTSSEVISNS